MRKLQLCAVLTLFVLPLSVRSEDQWVVYDGFDGPGKGKHVILISGDEEYRSEEALPQLGKILAKEHGFKCTVLFAIDKDGTINPNLNNIPGLEALDHADAMIIFTRFRDLPDEQMKHIVDFIDADRVFEHHLIRPPEIEKAGSRRGVSPRAEHDRYALS